ncbi:hypothetical protein Tco_0993649 [Tanacetum coccineum]
MIESGNKLIQFLGEILREQTANISNHTLKPSRRFNSFYDDDDYEKSAIPLNEIVSQIPLSNAITPVSPTLEPEDSLIIGNEELSTIPEKESDEVIKSSVENLVPIPSDNDESLSDEDVLEENVKIYSNPLFEFDDEYIFSDVNPLFDVVLENIESKEYYVSNLDEPALRSDDKEYEFSYADLPRLNMNNVEYMYLLQVQDKLHHLLLEFMKDFNNALLMFIRRTVIKNRVEYIQLGVESYQRTLNLTKPTMFFEGIDQKIPFTMTAMHKGVVYLNQYNIKSLTNLSEVKKFNDGTLVKIQENLIDMLSKNKLDSGNKRLKGKDWTDYDVRSSREMLKKIDEILRHKE